ncbi:MAG: hypothetical protein WCG85_24045 [Polyangia bacterium]
MSERVRVLVYGGVGVEKQAVEVGGERFRFFDPISQVLTPARDGTHLHEEFPR